MQGALRPDLVDCGAQRSDPGANAPAVILQLLLTGAARADAAAEPGKQRAAPSKSRKQIGQLGQFDLQLAFPAPSAACKNIQDQLGPVDHPQVQLPLQVAQLGGRKIVVEDDHVGGCSPR